MALKARWTPLAYTSLQETVKYLEKEWSERTAINFVRNVNQFIQKLERFPKVGKVEVKGKDIRGLVITRQTKVFYRIKGNKLILLRFFDTRQKPI